MIDYLDDFVCDYQCEDYYNWGGDSYNWYEGDLYSNGDYCDPYTDEDYYYDDEDCEHA